MSENVKGQDNQQQEQQQNQQQQSAAQDGATQGDNTQNASASRGGTTDMDDESSTLGRTNVSQRGSGITTKNAVTGSDFDGQAT